MRPRECTIDASCLIALASIGLIPKLAFLFSKVRVPKEVRREASRRRTTRTALKQALRSHAFLVHCEEGDETAARLLMGPHIQRGEAETIQQASATGSAVMIDEREGRKLAGTMSLEVHGTLWVLSELFNQGLIDGKDIASGLQRLDKIAYRLPPEAVGDLLERATGRRTL